MPKATLAADIMSRVTPVRFSYAWHHKLPPDVAAEVNAIRDRYRSGELGNVNLTRLAAAITETLSDRGIEMPRPRQVAIWLSEK
jgi:hypothetical protein